MKLYIIGNGFDRNHYKTTSWKHFHKYLCEHDYPIEDTTFTLNEIFDTVYSKQDLWSDFESALSDLDWIDMARKRGDDINIAFDDNDDIKLETERYQAQTLQTHLYPTIQHAINDWLRMTEQRPIRKTINNNQYQNLSEDEINEDTPVYRRSYFSNLINEDAIFLSFNYTHTLEKLYEIPSYKIIHIHGELTPEHIETDHHTALYGQRAESDIVFGHNAQPHPTNHQSLSFESCLLENVFNDVNITLKKRYRIEQLNQIDFNKINAIDVIGHGLGNIDKPYFIEINKRLKKPVPFTEWLCRSINQQPATNSFFEDLNKFSKHSPHYYQ